MYQQEFQSFLKKAQNRLIFSQQSHRHTSLIINQIHTDLSSIGKINKNSFAYHYPIGRGGFGKVWKCELKRTKHCFALKEMQKLRIISKRSTHSVMNEQRLLKTLKNPFIVNMHFAFQDRENLYLVLDLKKGGDLRYQLTKTKKFTEPQLKFFTCCILLGLKYIHSNQIIHRDIKPENLVFDEHGYLYITDFGIARECRADNSRDTSGTPGYMAPEVLFRKPHKMTADYYAIGVILYELMMCKRPYPGRERKELREFMLGRQVKISDTPEGFSKDSADFINKLLIRNPDNRLGSKGIAEILEHPWIKNEDWALIESKKFQPPFVPISEDLFDPKRVSEFKDEIDYSIDLASVQSMFISYNYDSRITEGKSSKRRNSLSTF